MEVCVAMRKMTFLTLMLSVMLVFVGTMAGGCSGKKKPPADAAKNENPDSALGGGAENPGGPVGLPGQAPPAAPATK